MVNGFKAFTELSTGNNGTGIHFSPNLEDCFHFVDAMNSPCKVARVSALGRVLTYNGSLDDYDFEYETPTYIYGLENAKNHKKSNPCR